MLKSTIAEQSAPSPDVNVQGQDRNPLRYPFPQAAWRCFYWDGLGKPSAIFQVLFSAKVHIPGSPSLIPKHGGMRQDRLDSDEIQVGQNLAPSIHGSLM